MNVGEICTRRLITVEQRDSLDTVARLMREHHVGSIIVVDKLDGHRMPLGLITDRDIVVEVIANQLDTKMLLARDILSNELVSVRETDDVWQAIKIMRDKGIRRTGVVDEFGILVGVLSIDDALEIMFEQLQDLVALLGNERLNEKLTRPASKGD